MSKRELRRVEVLARVKSKELKVTDPTLLTGIDSVFVTAESLGDAKRPRGTKILYAYIGGQPNHP